ncbi:MAG: hypothetical protein DDT31_00921 [Syntrophomonadaceae bacterium]|nr:hypothetical protein [Bacillota bacterium]
MSLQGRWKHSKDEIISQTLGKYMDLPQTRIDALTSLLTAETILTKGIAHKLVADSFGRLLAVPQTSEKYWLQRGWSPEDAILKSRERKLSG